MASKAPRLNIRLGEVGARGQGPSISGFRLGVLAAMEIHQPHEVPGLVIRGVRAKCAETPFFRFRIPARSMVLPSDCQRVHPPLPSSLR